MKTINLILGNHNHQPVGNFDFVCENTYQNAYKPFLDILEKYKDIKFKKKYNIYLLKKFITKSTNISFSFGLDCAISKVIATNVLLSMTCLPSL